ncbi:MAG: hypothetical protein H0T99_06955 [Geodermatophilaceae bacterium]|nr:hypothetical protein [Geodermatophilaceae bacterium]
MLILGQLAWWAERRSGVLPAALGWLLVAFTIINVLLVPISGFSLLLFPATIVLIGAHRLRNTGSTRHDPERSSGSATSPQALMIIQ